MVDLKWLVSIFHGLCCCLSLIDGSVLLSPTFDFIVGPTRKRVSVHSGIFEQFSPPLWNMMKSGMKEEKDREAELPDVSIDLFLAVIEFAMVGNYSPPQPVLRERQPYPDDASATTPVVANEDEDHWAQAFGSISKKSKKSKPKQDTISNDYDWDFGSNKRTIWSRFENLSFPGPKADRKRIPRPSDLTFHAELYCFAEEKMMQSLQGVCLHHLHADLMNLTLRPGDTAQIMALLELVYTRTARQCIDPPNRLRNLVICYVASQAAVLKGDQGLRVLLDEHAEIGSDLFYQMIEKE